MVHTNLQEKKSPRKSKPSLNSQNIDQNDLNFPKQYSSFQKLWYKFVKSHFQKQQQNDSKKQGNIEKPLYKETLPFMATNLSQIRVYGDDDEQNNYYEFEELNESQSGSQIEKVKNRSLNRKKSSYFKQKFSKQKSQSQKWPEKSQKPEYQSFEIFTKSPNQQNCESISEILINAEISSECLFNKKKNIQKDSDEIKKTQGYNIYRQNENSLRKLQKFPMHRDPQQYPKKGVLKPGPKKINMIPQKQEIEYIQNILGKIQHQIEMRKQEEEKRRNKNVNTCNICEKPLPEDIEFINSQDLLCDEHKPKCKMCKKNLLTSQKSDICPDCKQNQKSKAKKPLKKICKDCGKEFTVRRMGQFTCSPCVNETEDDSASTIESENKQNIKQLQQQQQDEVQLLHNRDQNGNQNYNQQKQTQFIKDKIQDASQIQKKLNSQEKLVEKLIKDEHIKIRDEGDDYFEFSKGGFFLAIYNKSIGNNRNKLYGYAGLMLINFVNCFKDLDYEYHNQNSAELQEQQNKKAGKLSKLLSDSSNKSFYQENNIHSGHIYPANRSYRNQKNSKISFSMDMEMNIITDYLLDSKEVGSDLNLLEQLMSTNIIPMYKLEYEVIFKL
ncbi:hypothetical protein PPERSA_12474 [Pseudocohnilembus persalinus]|uniref:Uncharacterized protein n=1 Tax=Pseudocohnilembus persalinus TaxID=266149 RepID=A0A0V0QP58_PSEPJ|nr:hypothetical protein PPERSA_12474 [Pseudocohnilembus persalinus]|eukprot:KRX04027.1 hypothetical protein PPERSA_12474 [Pseudocohnilembus persalinus]